MTIFSGIYSSLTGLLSFSDALNVISNDVSNLNTPGYKASNILFRDLGPDESGDRSETPSQFSDDLGQGVAVAGTRLSFSQGDIQNTGNDTDLAINGNGFFVLDQNGQQLFSRAGQFKFDPQGQLVDTATGAVVQAIDSSGNLSNFVVNPHLTNPAVATTAVSFNGNLSTGSPTAEVDNVKVIDASGATRTLTIKFQNNASSSTTPIPGGWSVTVLDESGTQVGNGQIQFDGTGAPEAGFNEIDFVLHAGGTQSSIELNFGTPGSTDGTTSNSAGAQSTIAVATTDGRPLGTLSSTVFDSNGVAQMTFTNGATASGPQLALANFSDPQQLTQLANSFFKADPLKLKPEFGRASTGGFGQLAPKSIELANVDLSQEFSEIVILQRGFQGSSQVLNISSQLLQDLYSDLSGH